MEIQLSATRLRAALDVIERPYLENIEGLRELLALQPLLGRRETWKTLLDKTTYKKWVALSDLYDRLKKVE